MKPKQGTNSYGKFKPPPKPDYKILKGPGVSQGEGVFLGNPLGIPRERLGNLKGTLGKIRGITTPGPGRESYFKLQGWTQYTHESLT